MSQPFLKPVSQHVFTIPHFWTPEMCERWMAESERIGYGDAPINTTRGPRVVNSVRNNKRVLHTDETLARSIWEDLAPFALPQIDNRVAIGLNELFRFYRYEPGEQFHWHVDHNFRRSYLEASYYTFMIYLNDNFTGGETTFENSFVRAQQGMALIFLHSLLHEGGPVLEGKKYVLRSDIMYALRSY